MSNPFSDEKALAEKTVNYQRGSYNKFNEIEQWIKDIDRCLVWIEKRGDEE